MDPDPTAPLGAGSSGFIVFASMIESSMKCSLIYAAEVKSRQYFHDKKILAVYIVFTFRVNMDSRVVEIAKFYTCPWTFSIWP